MLPRSLGSMWPVWAKKKASYVSGRKLAQDSEAIRSSLFLSSSPKGKQEQGWTGHVHGPVPAWATACPTTFFPDPLANGPAAFLPLPGSLLQGSLLAARHAICAPQLQGAAAVSRACAVHGAPPASQAGDAHLAGQPAEGGRSADEAAGSQTCCCRPSGAAPLWTCELEASSWEGSETLSGRPTTSPGVSMG